MNSDTDKLKVAREALEDIAKMFVTVDPGRFGAFISAEATNIAKHALSSLSSSEAHGCAKCGLPISSVLHRPRTPGAHAFQSWPTPEQGERCPLCKTGTLMKVGEGSICSNGPCPYELPAPTGF